MFILGLVLASMMASLASGSIQAWLPEVITGQEGKPLEIRCHYSGANPKKNWNMKLIKTLPDSIFMGHTVEPRFTGPVFTKLSCSSGTGVFTVQSLHRADEGRYACMVSQVNDPNDETVCSDYHTAYTRVVVQTRTRRSLRTPLLAQTAGPQSTQTPETTKTTEPPSPEFTVRAVKQNYKVWAGSSLHVECQFSGAVAGTNITATLLKETSWAVWDEVSTTSSSLTTLNLSPVIEGTGQAKWCSANATIEDSGVYMCMVMMEFPEGQEGRDDEFFDADTFKVTVVKEPGETADDDDYLFTESGEEHVD
ncbi:protein E2 [Equid gammaherpesvirus 2]|nr:protein E2 [Equid gammaherpesvirus 2]